MSTTDPNSTNIRIRARQTLDVLRTELLAQRVDDHWVGELAASALSTATAVSALSAVLLHGSSGDETLKRLVRDGVAYLASQQNEDGGFGDTDRSHSNIATSYLVLAASSLAHQSVGVSLPDDQQEALQDYISRSGETEALRKRYGKDKTFVIPILSNLAIAGLVDWNDVAALPFEAAVVPQSMYRMMQMPVVSYAIPALVAIGQARHFHGKKAFAPVRWIRAASIDRTMRVLLRMQPESGGYLEATPLTSFVVMSLAATDRCEHEVTKNGIRFLIESVRDDGSWPIDTNLATWVTSLAVHALSCDPIDDGQWCTPRLIDWHLKCQHNQQHPFTGARPGGWGWSDLSGAVPDSDDTPAAILALSRMQEHADGETRQRIRAAVRDGYEWLLELQNRDGGWPTFCRGWGKLPFDRSSNDLTAHALRALQAAEQHFGISATEQSKSQIRKAHRFLCRNQTEDGSWMPLWFGNQDRADESNPVYGSARVLLTPGLEPGSRQSAVDYLIGQQNPDGGWGGGPSLAPAMSEPSVNAPPDLTSSVEETALAVEALLAVLQNQRDYGGVSGVETGPVKDRLLAAIISGVEFLIQSVEDRRHQQPWPIGFYFAKLWYHEQLYPYVFAVAALGQFLQATDGCWDQN